MSSAEVLEVRAFFSQVGIWPATPRVVRPEEWLTNFKPEELPRALALLDAFVFLNEDMTEHLFRSAIRSAFSKLIEPGMHYGAAKAAWRAFLDEVIVTFPTGEIPNPADSGRAYIRRIRRTFGVREEQLMEPEDAAHAARASSRPVLFVDDFAGLGVQFLETWQRPAMRDGTSFSFAELDESRLAPVFYVPSICTQSAKDRVNDEAPLVQVATAHLLPHRASLLHPESPKIPEELRRGMDEFVVTVSERAGIPLADARGFGSLGLGIAFPDSIPDATLPIFHASTDTWRPLFPGARLA